MEELADLSGGFHYEILCNIGKRVPRVYLRHGSVQGPRTTLATSIRTSDICKSYQAPFERLTHMINVYTRKICQY